MYGLGHPYRPQRIERWTLCDEVRADSLALSILWSRKPVLMRRRWITSAAVHSSTSVVNAGNCLHRCITRSAVATWKRSKWGLTQTYLTSASLTPSYRAKSDRSQMHHLIRVILDTTNLGKHARTRRRHAPKRSLEV